MSQLAVAGPQMADREHPAEDEPAQRHDRQRHVDVEDLLDEALIGVERRVEEHERERDRDRGDCCKCEAAKTAAVHGQSAQSSSRKSNTA